VLLASYLVLGIAILIGDGHLAGLPLALASAILLAYAVKRESPVREQFVPWLVVLATTVVVADSPSPFLLVPITILQGLVGLAAYVRPTLDRRAAPLMLAASVGLYATAGALVIANAPEPRIDVFELQQLGARDLAAGHDPYAAVFPNPYDAEETRNFFGKERQGLEEYPYPPLSLLATGLGQALGGDVRWALLAAQLGIGVLLFALARGSGHPAQVATAITSLHFLHPRGFFMLEHAWTDSLIACAFLGFLLCIQRGRARWLGPTLALFLGFKQYSVVAVPLIFRDGRVPRRAWIEAIVIAVVVALPFFVWGPADFVNDVVLFQLRQPLRKEAMSIPAYLLKVTGWRAPGVLALAGAAAAGALAWKKLGPLWPAARLPLAAAFVYSCFFIFAKQAFCNYYYFDGALILAAAALLDPASIRGEWALVTRRPSVAD
jgi:hypothetical protein